MQSDEKIIIPLSKQKMILILTGSIIFVILGSIMTMNAEKFSNVTGRDPMFITCIGIAGVLFFGACVFFIARKLTDSKPGLIIDKNGLIDNSSSVSIGQILWSDIQSLSVQTVHRQKFILIFVNDPQAYINRQQGSFAKKLMQMNLNMYGTPLTITSTALKINFDELFEILTSRLTSYNQ